MVYYGKDIWTPSLYHHGIKGQKWGVRRYQNEDGSLTAEGKKRYSEIAGNSKISYDQKTGGVKIDLDPKLEKLMSVYGIKKSDVETIATKIATSGISDPSEITELAERDEEFKNAIAGIGLKPDEFEELAKLGESGEISASDISSATVIGTKMLARKEAEAVKNGFGVIKDIFSKMFSSAASFTKKCVKKGKEFVNDIMKKFKD